jgi:hypothetical protein
VQRIDQRGKIKNFFFLILFITRSQGDYFVKQSLLHARLTNSKPDADRIKILLELGKTYLGKLGETSAERDSAFTC